MFEYIKDFTRVDMDDLKLTGASIFGLSIINSEEIEFRQRTGKISPVSSMKSIELAFFQMTYIFQLRVEPFFQDSIHFL